MSTEEIVQAALSLPPETKAKLAGQLLESLEGSHDAVIDAAWKKEVEDRIDAYERGEMPAIPADEVFKALRQREKP